MIVRSKILIILVSLSTALMSFGRHRLVYIEGIKNNDGIVYNPKTMHVNLCIDPKIVPNVKLKEGIKLYIAYYLLHDKTKITDDFKKTYNTDIVHFGAKHKQQISNVIYYLEHVDHGNLPVIYKGEAYKLLELNELKPEINAIRKKLYKSGMLQIDVPGKLEDMQELVPKKRPDTIKSKN